MKASKIFVSSTTPLAMSGGAKALAIYPPQKGGPAESYALLEDGRMVTIKGARIQGVGVPRFLKENGFVLAEPGNPLAQVLADKLDIREGTDLVEKASQKEAVQRQKELANQTCSYVPFAEDEPIQTVKVTAREGYTTTLFDLSSAFSSGTVEIEFDVKNGIGTSIGFNHGWLVSSDVDASKMPRNTQYGGPVEHAVYTIVNCGLGTLIGKENLESDESAAADAPYPRGQLQVELNNGDMLIVGIDACDELGVEYWRDSTMVYRRCGMFGTRLGQVIGAIAAAIVRVRELDEELAAKLHKKAA